MTRRLLPATFLIATLALALTACDPTPDPGGSSSPSTSESSTPSGTSSPTPEAAAVAPARGDLAISPEGMGTLVFGTVPPSAPTQAMIVLEPDWCTDANTGIENGVAPGDPDAAAWTPIPAYRDARFADFGVEVFGGVLDRIDRDFTHPTIPTTAGVRVGDGRAAVEAAYPDATVVSFGITDVYVVTGTHGTLQLEVSTTDPYWEGFRDPNVVVYIHATQAGIAPFTVAGTENIAGGCVF